MRILVATDHWYPEHRGGAARVATETAALLAARGHDVEAIVPPGSVLPRTFADPWRVARAARGREPDVALAHTTTAGVGIARALPGVPLVLVYHASAVREARFERSRRRGGRRLELALLERPLRRLERAAIVAASRIVVLSEFSRGLVAADHPEAADRVQVVSGGVDTDAFAPGDRAAARARLGVGGDRPLLLTVRRLEPRMGLEDLLLATSRLAGVELVVVGTGSLAAELARRRDALGLRDRVRFAGLVSDGELLDWYQAADLFVLPTVAYEGFGIVTAEALACGLPVVGTAAGATPELLEPLDERLVVRGTGAAALARTIEQVVGMLSPALRAECRSYALKRLAWDVVAPRWEAAVNSTFV